MKMNMITRILNARMPLFICVIVLFSHYVFAGEIEDIQVLKISPEDGLAVIKGQGGKMEVIKAGDVITSYQRSAVSKRDKSNQRSAVSSQDKSGQPAELKVIEIAKDRVVLEEKKGDESEMVIIRIENGKQRVERLRKTAPKQQGMYKVR